jgi:hypothetical protein
MFVCTIRFNRARRAAWRPDPSNLSSAFLRSSAALCEPVFSVTSVTSNGSGYAKVKLALFFQRRHIDAAEPERQLAWVVARADFAR